MSWFLIFRSMLIRRILLDVAFPPATKTGYILFFVELLCGLCQHFCFIRIWCMFDQQAMAIYAYTLYLVQILWNFRSEKILKWRIKLKYIHQWKWYSNLTIRFSGTIYTLYLVHNKLNQSIKTCIFWANKYHSQSS